MVFIDSYIYIKEPYKGQIYMSLEKLLAENMLRFGTKNLAEQTQVNSTIYGTRFGTYTLQEMAGIVSTYNPSNGYIAISDGNQWLANQRAKSLSVFFSKNVSKILGIPYNSKAVKISEAKVLGAGAENQYVTGTLYAILEKPGKPEREYKYSLLYKFYEVDGIPHIVSTSRVGKMGSPRKITRIGGAKAFAEKYITDYMPNVPADSKLVWQQFGGGGEGNLGVMIPLPNGYSKRDGSALYFDSQEQFDTMRNFIAKYTDITSGIPLSKSGTQSVWYSSPGGGGNYIFGSPSGTKVVYLPTDVSKLPEIDRDKNQFINPEIVTIRRTSFDKNTGDIDGSKIDGTGTKAETKKIGEFKFDRTMFSDNMIRIKNSPELQAKLQEIKKAYDDVISANPEFVVKSVSSIVEGYASSNAATNRTNSGEPDHGWGINWPVEKWITK